MSALSRLMLAVALAAASAILVPAPASAGTYDVRQCDWAAGIPDHDFVWQAWGSPPLIPHADSNCSEFGLSARSAPGFEQTYPSGSYGGWFAYAAPGTVITHFSGAFGTLANCCINGLATRAEATRQGDGSGALAYLFLGDLGNHTWYEPSGPGGPVERDWDASTSGFGADRVGFQVRCGPGFSCLQRTSGDLRVRGRSFRFTVRDAAPPTVGAANGTLLDDRWLRGSQTLSLVGFDVGGGVAAVEAELDDGTVVGSPARCAIVGGEYVRLQPCPVAQAGAWTVDTATLPDGRRAVTLRVRDASGAIATSVRSLRVDNTPPVVRFAPGDPAAPSIVAAEVEDISGLADGAIELKRAGTEAWHPIPTTRVGMRLEAGVDAADATKGYELRARAVDAAGNQTVREGTGRTLPVRSRTRLNATVARRQVVTARYRSRVAVRGRLATIAGQPLAGRAVSIKLVSRDRTRESPSTPTDAGGRFGFTLPALRSAVVTLRFGGDGNVLPSSRQLSVDVPAPVTISADRQLLHGGGRVVFRGRVRGGSIPGTGKLVEVQAHFRGRWRTISAVRTRRDGRWRFHYGFRPGPVTARYRLRASVPVEAGYPFAAGRSRPVRVTVQPR